MDEVETVLKIKCAPITWPIGMGKRFKGVYHLYKDEIHLFSAQHGGKIAQAEVIKGLHNSKLDTLLGDQAAELRDEIDLVKGASHEFVLEDYLNGQLSPVFFGSAINNFGI
jgi:peptide chain release factor 3